ncbi:hypothetical protein ACMFMG_008691, partial [Clarireedia jacksonii]
SPPSHPAFGNAKTVERHLTIESATDIINSWLTACEQTHPLCRVPIFQLPKRVLNIAGELPKVVETNSCINGKYITLSHCWGQDPHIRPTMTTSSNIQSWKEGIPAEKLCTLFKDFINLARCLRCEFVWIDSLCIIQDDHEDWLNESGKMADIYSNSFFNVAATSLPDSSHSLFGERRTSYFLDHASGPLRIYTLNLAANASDTISIRASHYLDHGFLFDEVVNGRHQQAPLLDRAWVLQERLLASRAIHFCGSELIWECGSSCTCECMSIYLQQDHETQDPAVSSDDARPGSSSSEQPTSLKQLFAQLRHGALSPQRAYNFWLQLLFVYSGLHLSKPWDRYHAFAGIADTFNRTVKDKCIAGIWEKDIARGLSWTGSPRSSQNYSRSSIAPTWSWMSRFENFQGQFASTIGYNHINDKFVPDEHLVIRHSSQGAYISFGLCKDNILDITAAVIPAQISINTARSGKTEYYIDLQQSTSIKQRFLFWADCPSLSSDNLKEGDKCLCLIL